jgi:8-oxo-dGTP pyrophosphatase MutT (NUDIX family)
LLAKLGWVPRTIVGALALLVRRPKARQVAALCIRKGASGKEILMVTSLKSGQWIIPKGWPMEGKDFPQTALEEAWEEAGVSKGRIEGDMIGAYSYKKVQGNGTELPCLVDVYSVKVDKLEEQFPESDARKRRWFCKAEAIKLVSKPELKKIISII